MSIYPDTTFLVALRFFDDTHHRTATEYFASHDEASFLWSPWHRVEASNAFRQFARGDRPVMREGDARRIIHRLETDVRLGYFLHMEADWRDVLRTAYDLSAEHGYTQSCLSADLLHVAYAKELAAALFVSFDDDQVALAEAAGLRALRPR